MGDLFAYDAFMDTAKHILPAFQNGWFRWLRLRVLLLGKRHSRQTARIWEE